MNSLFHKFESRQLQFSLELMARLSRSKEVSHQVLYNMSVQYGLEHADKCVEPLVTYGLLMRTKHGVRMAEDLMPPQIPLSEIEDEYLQYILRIPEAELFLSPRVLYCLMDPYAQSAFDQIQYYGVQEREPVPNMDSEQFQNLIRAIRERRWIHYSFLAMGNPSPQTAQAVPWKLEHSAYDGRWWAILYLPNERRTVKAWLPNLRDIRLGIRSDVTDAEIEAAMEKLLVDKPVVIRITQEKKGLERCARVFERQMLQQIRREADGHYTLTFRYYKFDRNEILRKLLYLGSAVQLLEPEDLRKDLLMLINQALSE